MIWWKPNSSILDNESRKDSFRLKANASYSKGEFFLIFFIVLEFGISQIIFSTVMLYFTWITTTSGFQTQIILFHCNKRSRSRLKWRQEQELKKFFRTLLSILLQLLRIYYKDILIFREPYGYRGANLTENTFYKKSIIINQNSGCEWWIWRRIQWW